MTRDNNSSNRLQRLNRRAYPRGATTSIIIIAILQVAFIVLLGIAAFLGGLDAGSIATLAEGSFISTGIAIIGIAVAVWAGLNIVNALDRRSLEELSVCVSTLEEKVNMASASLEAWKNERLGIEKEAFLQEVQKNIPNVLSRYFYAEFMNTEFSDYYILKDLIQIEQCFRQIYSLHQSAFGENQELISKSKQGERLIQQVKEKIAVQDEPIHLINVYLDCREADMVFYRGYCLKNKDDQYQAFISAGKKHIALCELFSINLPMVNEEMHPDLHISSNENEKDMEIAAYFANAIGESFSKAVHVGSEGVSVAHQILITDAKRAVFYCICAVLFTQYRKESLITNEVYYRNLGCAYERLDRLESKSTISTQQYDGTWPAHQPFQHAEKIFDNYKKAYDWMRKPSNLFKMFPKRVDNIYHTLLSYSERYLCYILCGNIDSIKWSSINTIKERITSERAQEMLDITVVYYTVSQRAISHFPQYAKYASLHGFSIGWLLLMTQNDMSLPSRVELPTDAALFRALNNVCLYLESIQEHDNYANELFARYDMLKQCIKQ